MMARPETLPRLFFIGAVFILLLFLSDGQAAGLPYSKMDDLPFAVAVSRLEESHAIRIFYRDEWISQKHLSGAITSLPLHQALEEIVAVTGLQVLNLGTVVILFPSDLQGVMDPIAPARGVSIVGDPAEYGRHPQATISGTVRDGATEEPLPGVVLYEAVTGRGATTNALGWYELELPTGPHRLRITFMGYEPRVEDIRLLSEGSLDLELFELATRLAEVTISSRRVQENIMRTQMSMVRLDARDLKEIPQTFGERDIVRTITLLPGIQTVGEFGMGFNVRGGSADQNLVLLENVPLFNSSHMFGIISVVNPDMVQEASLMKAGIPANFGERASSVLDIRLGSKEMTEKLAVSGGIGLLNSRLMTRVPVVKGKGDLQVGFRSTYSDWLLRSIPDVDLYNSSSGFYDLTALSRIQLGAAGRLTLFGYYSFDRFGLLEESRNEYDNLLASARLNTILTSRLSSTLVAGRSRYRNDVFETSELEPFMHSAVHSSVDYASLKWSLTYEPSHRHSIQLGVGAISYDISPGEIRPLSAESIVPPGSIPTEQALELSAFLTDEFSIGDRMSLEAGLRYTQYTMLGPASVIQYREGMPRRVEFITDTLLYGKGDEVVSYSGAEPRIAWRFQLDEHSSVKASYGQINQYINMVSNTSVMAPSDIWKLSNAHLRPLQSNQFALGYFRNFMKNSIEASAEVYFKHNLNALEYKSGAEIAMNPRIEGDLINVKGRHWGMELYVRKNMGRLTGWTSYTYSSSMHRSGSPHPEEQINRNTYFPSNYDRPHNFVMNTSYHISQRWRFGVIFSYSTGRPVTLPESMYPFGNDILVFYSDRNKYRLPDYHRLDLSISMGEGHRITQRLKGSFTFSIMNVYGRKNPYSVFYKREPAGRGKLVPSFELYQLIIIGRPVPTIMYSFSF
jgi:hypothetical protein